MTIYPNIYICKPNASEFYNSLKVSKIKNKEVEQLIRRRYKAKKFSLKIFSF